MSAATLIANNPQTSPHKRRTKPLSTASSYNYTDKPKSGSGISGDSFRDTSVNVAGAFTQAVQDFTMSSRQTNGYSTALSNGNGIGAPPPPRSRKPLSRASRGRAPDESDDDVDGARLRGKSPLMEAASSFVRALSPGGSLYLRQKAGGDEEPSGYQSLTGAFSGIKPQSSQSSLRGAGAPLSNVSSDYNYSREESLAKRMDPPTKPVSAAAKKKIAPRPSGGTINIDKQAYKPSVDEEEEDEEEWSEDERGHRRKRAKLGPTQRKLNNLPTVGAHVKHRRGPRRKKANGEDGSETDTPGPTRDSAGRSLRGSAPPRAEDSTWQDSYDGADQNEYFADEYAIADSQAHPSQSAFSIGGLLGKLVNLGYHLVAETVKLAVGAATMISVLALRLVGSVFDALLIKPLSFISSSSQKLFGSIDWSNVLKGALVLLALWMFFNSLMVQSPGWISWPPKIPTRNPPPIIYDPDNSNAALLDLARRLQDMETRIIDIQFAQRRAFDRLDSQSRLTEESMKKLDTLDTAVSKGNQARVESEEKLRSTNSASISSLRTEISSMMSQVNNNGGSNGVPDERVLLLERRLQAAEAGVKDAVEASKQAVASASKVVSNPSSSGDSAGTRWWDKISGTDGKTLTIKSSDGRDVTGLIGTLVDNAVSKWTKDDIAIPDYASYFAGARIIPQLTSQTYKIATPSSWGSWGWFGSPSAEGRPPVTALHPDIHVGNCWPFKGAQGQLGVMLARSIIITDVTIDHAAKEVAFDVRSAPKKMEVWGLVDGEQNVKKVAEYHKRREQRYRDLVTAANREGRTPPLPEDPYPSTLPPDAHYLRLAQFTYDVNSNSHIQTFSVPQEIQDLGVDIGVVVLMVRNNWGDPNWTCLYRFRVSGHDMDRRPYPLEDIEAP